MTIPTESYKLWAMKKSTLERKIKDIAKHLNSDAAQEAIETLMLELESYFFDENTEVQKGEFSLPGDLSLQDQDLVIFTDGACRGNPGPGSYAFLIQNAHGDVVSEGADIAPQTTNNKMELSAIIKGVETALEQNAFVGRIILYTDSKYAVDGINSWVEGWKRRGWKKADNKAPENLELWKKLDSLNQSYHISFRWVKGHSGHPQNEYVDKLANLALDDNGF